MRLSEFTGQEHAIPVLEAEVRAARTKAMRHCLFFGPSGLGKTTLARTLANELGCDFWTLSPREASPCAPFLLRLSTKGYDSAGRPRTGAARHVVFVDECHKMKDFEDWYEPLQSCHVAHSGKVSWLPYFTFIGATNRPELLPKPFVDRCPLTFTLRPYTVEQYAQIVRDAFPVLSKETAQEVGRRARGSARTALSHAESVLNFGGLDYFSQVGIDERGLTEADRAYLDALRSSSNGMSLASVSAAIGQCPATVADTVEPYLISLGLVEIVSGRGRVLTEPGRGERAEPATEVPLRQVK